MSTVATMMMKGKIDDAGIPNLEELLEMAQAEGVKLVACKMTADMMDLSGDDFIEDVAVMNAEGYLKTASGCQINMFT